MSERYSHYGKNGTMTARLEIVRSEETSAAETFVIRHIDTVREYFDGAISTAADEAYEAMCARDHGYRYRPYIVSVTYDAARRGHRLEMRIMISCTSGRRAIYSSVERHMFRVQKEGTLYLGRAREKLTVRSLRRQRKSAIIRSNNA